MSTEESYLLDDGTHQIRSRGQSRSKLLWIFVVLLFGAAVTMGVLFALQVNDDGENQPATGASTSSCAVPGLPRLPPDNLNNELRYKLAVELGNQLNTTRSLLIYMLGSKVVSHFLADTELMFWQESNFMWMTGYEKGDSAELLCLWTRPTLNASNISCSMFLTEPDLAFKIWNGEAPTLPELRARYQVDDIYWKSNFSTIVSSFLAQAEAYGLVEVHTLPSVQQLETVIPPELANLTHRTDVLRIAMGAARGIKTAKEVELMRYAHKVTNAAHMEVMRVARNSQYEFQVQAAFDAVHTACGMKQWSYLPIVASGSRSAILHYNTNLKELSKDWLLIDAGGTYLGYGADVTRSFPISGKFSTEQRIVYNIVLEAQLAALSHYVAGTKWTEAANAASNTLVEGLSTAGLLNGSLQELTAAGMAGIFMPHSLGHHLGLDVHDYVPGGLGQCRPSEDPEDPVLCPGTFKAGMVLTAEPGCYFIPEKLEEGYNDPVKSKFMVKSVIDRFYEAGASVRIEDVAHILPQGQPELFTSTLPKSVGDIEKFMSG